MNVEHAQVEKPALVYYPSQIDTIPEDSGKDRLVHLVSLGLKVAQVERLATRTLPFYVRGLLRAVPVGVLPEAFALAAMSGPDFEVLMDHVLCLWAREKNWDDYRPIAGDKLLNIGCEDRMQAPIATVAISQVELAEGFLDQLDEGQAPQPRQEDPDEDEDEFGAMKARKAPSIKDKPDPKRKSKGGSRNRSNTPGRSGSYTRSAYTLLAYRYPILVLLEEEVSM